MPIQEGNIVFVESQVMDDVSEGGGAATGRVVTDGALNNVFEDISDLDRAYGRFNLRKLFLAVRSLDTDLYGGAKLAITQLPDDPALGYAMFTTGDAFDTRLTAEAKVAAYLYKGTTWQGGLLENHIAGTKQIRVIQRLGTALPPSGKTLCLVWHEGLADQKEQYVRVTGVDSAERTFSYMNGSTAVDFERLEVTLTLSDALRFDFIGHTPNPTDAYNYTTGTRIRDTTVADATNYFGSQTLVEDAESGALQVRAASMFAQLVPSAQTETPLVNQVMAGAITQAIAAGGGHTVNVAQSPHTRAQAITAENRRLNWIETLAPLPATGTLSVSFMAQGNWYVLSDNGAGGLAGADAGSGAGTVDYSTGSAAVTLGALPDVGSQIMYVWASPVHYAQQIGTITAKRTLRHALEDAIKPGSLEITWLAGGATKTATADTAGIISGQATGHVSHVTGDLWIEFLEWPDSDTTVGVAYTRVNAVEKTLTGVTETGGLTYLDVEEAIEPGSLQLQWSTVNTSRHSGEDNEFETIYNPEYPVGHQYQFKLVSTTVNTSDTLTRYRFTCQDNGLGAIVDDETGSVNYATGEIVAPLLPAISTVVYENHQWDEPVDGSRHAFVTGIVIARYTPAGAAPTAVDTTIPLAPAELRILPTMVASPVVPGSLRMTLGTVAYEDRGTGRLYTTATGVEAGAIDYATGICTLSFTSGAWSTANVTACLIRYGQWVGTDASFRTQLSPLKPEALSISVTTEDGELLTGSADAEGVISGAAMLGSVNEEFGTASVEFGAMGDDPDYTGDPPAPQVWIPRRVDPSTLRYNAVAYSYLPLDATILGIDPVRLPSDGRVPIYRDGGLVYVMHTDNTAPATIADGGTISAGRTRLAWARVIDDAGATVPGDLYTLDRAAGTITIPDVSGLDQPLTLRHTIADLRMVTDAQISGWLTLSRPLTHDYPADESIVAGCLIFGDRRARVSLAFDQTSWTSVWQDSLIGASATATLNLIDFPITVTNEGCDTDRWLFRCTNAATNAWELISENRGLVWSGTYAVGGADVAPINARTRTWDIETGQWIGGTPYLVIPGQANGGGWATGNCIRINTIGAIADFWIARSIQQSDEPLDDGYDSVEIYALGNVDRP